MGSHFVFLQHLLENEVTADTVFLVYEEARQKINSISNSDYRFLPFGNEKYVRDYFDGHDVPYQVSVSTYLPFLSVAYYNVELFFPAVFSLIAPNFQYRYDEVGDFGYASRQLSDGKL